MAPLEKLFMKQVNRFVLAKAEDIDKSRDSFREIDKFTYTKINPFTLNQKYIELIHQEGEYRLSYGIKTGFDYRQLDFLNFAEQNKRNQQLLSVLYDYIDNKLREQTLRLEMNEIKRQSREKEIEKRNEKKVRKNYSTREEGHSSFL
jgi:hypothetical protein